MLYFCELQGVNSHCSYSYTSATVTAIIVEPFLRYSGGYNGSAVVTVAAVIPLLCQSPLSLSSLFDPTSKVPRDVERYTSRYSAGLLRYRCRITYFDICGARAIYPRSLLSYNAPYSASYLY